MHAVGEGEAGVADGGSARSEGAGGGCRLDKAKEKCLAHDFRIMGKSRNTTGYTCLVLLKLYVENKIDSEHEIMVFR